MKVRAAPEIISAILFVFFISFSFFSSFPSNVYRFFLSALLIRRLSESGRCTFSSGTQLSGEEKKIKKQDEISFNLPETEK